MLLRVWVGAAVPRRRGTWTCSARATARSTRSGGDIRDDLLDVAVEPDGVVFDPGLDPDRARSATRTSTRARASTLRARCGTARLTLQVDVGLGDAVVAARRSECAYPTLLGHSRRRRFCAYPPRGGRRREARGHGRARRPQQPHQGLLRPPSPREPLRVRPGDARRRRSRDLRATATPHSDRARRSALTPRFCGEPSRRRSVRAFARRARLPSAGSRTTRSGAQLGAFLQPSWATATRRPFETDLAPGRAAGRPRREPSERDERQAARAAAVQAVPGVQGLRRRVAGGDSGALGGEAAQACDASIELQRCTASMLDGPSTVVTCWSSPSSRTCDVIGHSMTRDLRPEQFDRDASETRPAGRSSSAMRARRTASAMPMATLRRQRAVAVRPSPDTAASDRAAYLTYLIARACSVELVVDAAARRRSSSNRSSSTVIAEAASTALVPPPRRATRHRRLPRPGDGEDRCAGGEEGAADRAAPGEAHRPHHPRRHQGPRPERPHEGLRRRVAGGDSGALGGEAPAEHLAPVGSADQYARTASARTYRRGRSVSLDGSDVRRGSTSDVDGSSTNSAETRARLASLDFESATLVMRTRRGIGERRARAVTNSRVRICASACLCIG